MWAARRSGPDATPVTGPIPCNAGRLRDGSLMEAPTPPEKRRVRALPLAGLALGALLVAALLLWQALTAAGSPDPTLPHTSGPQAILDIAVLVFREGLECILVLSAITAGLMGTNQRYRLHVGLGAGIGFIATLITWFIAINIVDKLTQN